MRYDGRIGIAIFAVLITLSIASSFYITPTTISDSDPSTYVIVPMLMLPLFAAFMAKERMRPFVGRRDMAAGMLSFALLLVLTVALRSYFSYLFASYRLDMLLFPLLIASYAFLLFGSGNVRKFRAIMAYSLLASPLLLAPLIGANQGFAALNSEMVYGMAGLFVHGLAYIAPFTLSANGYSIGIGQACVGVGVLIGIVLFLIPVSYLYKGSMRNKALWVASGLGLLFLLNVARMLGIAMAWVTYGPSEAVATIHLFAGILLFYLSIIVMMLASGRFGLALDLGGKGGVSGRVRHSSTKAGIALAVVLGLAYLALTLNYSSAMHVSPTHLGRSSSPAFSNSTVAPMLSSLLELEGMNSSLWLLTGSSASLRIWGRGISNDYPVMGYVTYPNSSIEYGLLSENTLLGRMGFVDGKGISGTVYYLESNGTGFMVYDARLPYVLPGEDAYSKLSVYLVMPSVDINSTCTTIPGAFFTYSVNVFNRGMYEGNVRRDMLNAYCAMDRLVA